jgi:hypothetical protein
MRQKRNFLTETFFVGSGKAERAFSKNDFFVGNGLILVRIFFLFRRFDDKKMLVIEGKKMIRIVHLVIVKEALLH